MTGGAERSKIVPTQQDVGGTISGGYVTGPGAGAGTKPLDGLLVLTLGQVVAAPYRSSRLTDAGARVIKVERPEVPAIGQHDAAIRRAFGDAAASEAAE